MKIIIIKNKKQNKKTVVYLLKIPTSKIPVTKIFTISCGKNQFNISLLGLKRLISEIIRFIHLIVHKIRKETVTCSFNDVVGKANN